VKNRFDQLTTGGFSLVEAVIAVALTAAFILSLSYVNSFYARTALGHAKQLQASFLAEEGIEAARLMRDSSWSNQIASLAPGTQYYLYFSGSAWQATTTATNPTGFERRIVFGEVRRDSNSNIITSGGSVDSGSRLVTTTVSWQEKGETKNKELSIYLTDLYSN
jgi:Tfp pilus assembly protein PilV